MLIVQSIQEKEVMVRISEQEQDTAKVRSPGSARPGKGSDPARRVWNEEEICDNCAALNEFSCGD